MNALFDEHSCGVIDWELAASGPAPFYDLARWLQEEDPRIGEDNLDFTGFLAGLGLDLKTYRHEFKKRVESLLVCLELPVLYARAYGLSGEPGGNSAGSKPSLDRAMEFRLNRLVRNLSRDSH